MDKRQRRRNWEVRQAERLWKHWLKRQRHNKYRAIDRLAGTQERRARGEPLLGYRSSYAEQKPETLKAAQTFSLLQEPETTVRFLNTVVSKMSMMRRVFLDVSNVTVITIDTLLYLLASMDRLKQLKMPTYVQGNYPKHRAADRIFRESGFFKFTAKGATSAMSKVAGTVQIREGTEADPQLARELCVFAQEQLQLHRTQTKFLYDIVMEIIVNTRQHAYEDKNHVVAKWYSYATYDKQKKEVLFSILDTGQGIPATVKTDWQEGLGKMLSSMGLDIKSAHDEWFITSALNGDLRTKTGEKHRGKGLPKIMGYFKEGKVSDLTVISNHGYVSLKDERRIEMAAPFKGTLYSWRLRRAN